MDPAPSSDRSPSPGSNSSPLASNAAEAPAPANPGAFYRLDYSRGSLREFFYGNPPTRYPAIALSALIIKLGRIRVPASSDHPPVESLKPFEVSIEQVPEEIRQRFEPLGNELIALGFGDPIFHLIADTLHSTRYYRATFRHAGGRAWARIHHRIWDHVRPPRVYLFPQFLTGFTDGAWLLSCAGKPDTQEPPTFRVNRHPGMSAAELWKSHQQWLDREAARAIIPARTREEVAAQSEANHAALRTFHLHRGFFQPLAEADQQAMTRMSTAAAQGDSDAPIHEELNRLLGARPGWGNAIVILVISLLVFLWAGVGGQRDWKFLLLLIPILLIHELGHYLAMRGFRYRNLRMFFIPWFGAAVTGQNFNVPGWKKALVYLAGPVPSIVLAVVAGGVGLILQRDWLLEAAFLSLFINAFNLLPVLPMDGGWVMQITLFSRHHLLDTVFRALAALALIALGTALDARLLWILGGLALFALPVSYKLAKITNELRSQNLPLPSADEAGIPRETADAIIHRVKSGFTKGVTDKSLAQHSLQVFEALNARPPGWAASFGLLGIQWGSFLLAIVFGSVFAFAKMGGGFGLGGWGWDDSRWAPRWEAPCDSALTWRGSAFSWSQTNRLLVANFEERSPAVSAFQSLTNGLPADASLRCFGHTLFLLLPATAATETSSPDAWFDRLEGFTTNVHALGSASDATVRVRAVAPDEERARAIEEELSAYCAAPNPERLMPPWLMERQASATELAAFRKARATWPRLLSAGADLDTNAALKEIRGRLNQARRRGNKAEQARLNEEYQAERRRLEVAAIQALPDASEAPLDTQLVGAYLQLPENRYTNRDYQEALLALAPRFGALTETNGRARPEEQAVTLRSGSVGRPGPAAGAAVILPFVVFENVAEGLPALADWLCRQGCDQIKYDLLTFPDVDDADEEAP